MRVSSVSILFAIVLFSLIGVAHAGKISTGVELGCLGNTVYSADTDESFTFDEKLICSDNRWVVDTKGWHASSTSDSSAKMVKHQTNVLYVKTNHTVNEAFIYNLTGFPGYNYIDIFEDGALLTTLNSTSDGDVYYVSDPADAETSHYFIAIGAYATTTTTSTTSTTTTSTVSTTSTTAAPGGGGGPNWLPETTTTLEDIGFIPPIVSAPTGNLVDNTLSFMQYSFIETPKIPPTQTRMAIPNWVILALLISLLLTVARSTLYDNRDFRLLFGLGDGDDDESR